jgi:D-beta-D-heptose 7-phosphate kinase/D-beta-D-heptose 1-phosphate adenosyltransferase|uniref:Bifunctional protein HldE n=1 Tax=Desulfobacca acetoxidans TaxID=60893 RepID=A0A7V6A2F8_9BACT
MPQEKNAPGGGQGAEPPPPSLSLYSATSWERLRQADLGRFSGVTVLVAGDFMLDEYIWGNVSRISPEAPVTVVEVEQETRTLGGAGNVVNNLAALGAKVEVLGLVGEDAPAATMRQELGRLQVEAEGLFTDSARHTTRKTRVYGGQQQVVRIDRETRTPAPASFTNRALEYLKARLPRLSALILSDYAKGALTPEFLKQAIDLARRHRVPVVVDPKGRDYSPYAGATVVTPNVKELEQTVGRPLGSWEERVAAARQLRQRLDIDALLVTEGAAGMTLINPVGAVRLQARTPREVFDVSGAGDTVVAVLTLGLAAGFDLIEAAGLANLAAGVVVTKRGTAPILLSEMESELKGHVHQEEKIVELTELSFIVPHLRAQGKRVVFTNGCFDLLHVGHVRFLEESKQRGDVLVVAVDTDASVRRVKGEGRPVLSEQERLRMLAALAAVDYVALFESAQLPEILASLKPDILTKGSNYPEVEVEGRDIVTGYGGQIALIPVHDPVSITGLIHRIRQE